VFALNQFQKILNVLNENTGTPTAEQLALLAQAQRDLKSTAALDALYLVIIGIGMFVATLFFVSRLWFRFREGRGGKKKKEKERADCVFRRVFVFVFVLGFGFGSERWEFGFTLERYVPSFLSSFRRKKATSRLLSRRGRNSSTDSHSLASFFFLFFRSLPRGSGRSTFSPFFVKTSLSSIPLELERLLPGECRRVVFCFPVVPFLLPRFLETRLTIFPVSV